MRTLVVSYNIRMPLLSRMTPEGVGVWCVCWRYPGVSSSGPEPSVNVDGLELVLFAALVLEVALSTRSVNGGDVVWMGRKWMDNVIQKRGALTEWTRTKGARSKSTGP